MSSGSPASGDSALVEFDGDDVRAVPIDDLVYLVDARLRDVGRPEDFDRPSPLALASGGRVRRRRLHRSLGDQSATTFTSIELGESRLVDRTRGVRCADG